MASPKRSSTRCRSSKGCRRRARVGIFVPRQRRRSRSDRREAAGRDGARRQRAPVGRSAAHHRALSMSPTGISCGRSATIASLRESSTSRRRSREPLPRVSVDNGGDAAAHRPAHGESGGVSPLFARTASLVFAIERLAAAREGTVRGGVAQRPELRVAVGRAGGSLRDSVALRIRTGGRRQSASAEAVNRALGLNDQVADAHRARGFSFILLPGPEGGGRSLRAQHRARPDERALPHLVAGRHGPDVRTPRSRRRAARRSSIRSTHTSTASPALSTTSTAAREEGFGNSTRPSRSIPTTRWRSTSPAACTHGWAGMTRRCACSPAASSYPIVRRSMSAITRGRWPRRANRRGAGRARGTRSAAPHRIRPAPAILRSCILRSVRWTGRSSCLERACAPQRLDRQSAHADVRELPARSPLRRAPPPHRSSGRAVVGAGA